MELHIPLKKLHCQKHLTSPSLPPKKKLCGSRRFGKMIKKSLGGGRPPVAVPLLLPRSWFLTVFHPCLQRSSLKCQNCVPKQRTQYCTSELQFNTNLHYKKNAFVLCFFTTVIQRPVVCLQIIRCCLFRNLAKGCTNTVQIATHVIACRDLNQTTAHHTSQSKHHKSDSKVTDQIHTKLTHTGHYPPRRNDDLSSRILQLLVFNNDV